VEEVVERVEHAYGITNVVTGTPAPALPPLAWFDWKVPQK
jgi:hypothetical protein